MLPLFEPVWPLTAGLFGWHLRRPVAEAVARLGLRYAVITTVARDDLPDGGASAMAATVRAVRDRRLCAGDLIVSEITPCNGGYFAQLCRTLILGEPNDLQKEKGCVIVEGAGGFLVPLNDQKDLGDFAQQIQLPVILVVGMKLGCINHALLTIEAILARKLVIAGWIANTLDQEMGLLSENIETLQSRISAPFLGLIPKLPTNIQKLSNQPYSLEALKFAAQHIQLPAE